MSGLIQNLLIGVIVAAIVWIFLLPLLTGTIHTIAVIIFVVVVILWLLRVGGIIN